VARDRREPGRGLARLDAAEQAAVGGEERLLRSVFRLGGIAQEGPADAQDETAVRPEELGETCAGRPLLGAAGLDR